MLIWSVTFPTWLRCLSSDSTSWLNSQVGPSISKFETLWFEFHQPAMLKTLNSLISGKSERSWTAFTFASGLGPMRKSMCNSSKLVDLGKHGFLAYYCFIGTQYLSFLMHLSPIHMTFFSRNLATSCSKAWPPSSRHLQRRDEDGCYRASCVPIFQKGRCGNAVILMVAYILVSHHPWPCFDDD